MVLAVMCVLPPDVLCLCKKSFNCVIIKLKRKILSFYGKRNGPFQGDCFSYCNSGHRVRVSIRTALLRLF